MKGKGCNTSLFVFWVSVAFIGFLSIKLGSISEVLAILLILGGLTIAVIYRFNSRKKINNKRRAPTQEIKHAVFRRDGGRCQRCGTTKNLQYDHKIPYSRGGETTIDNLQLLCKKCNQRKKDKMIWL